MKECLKNMDNWSLYLGFGLIGAAVGALTAPPSGSWWGTWIVAAGMALAHFFTTRRDKETDE